jgi:hypothetical protein
MLLQLTINAIEKTKDSSKEHNYKKRHGCQLIRTRKNKSNGYRR